jgi:hypothetical protein
MCISVNGDHFEGMFANDKREGKGILFYRDGCSIYEGLWRDDKAICGTYKKLPDKTQNDLPILEILKPDTVADDMFNKSIDGIVVGESNKSM